MNIKRKIVADSSCELISEIIDGLDIELIPFNIEIADEQIVDDGTLNTSEFIEKMSKSKGHIKSAAPSPNLFLESYKNADEIFAVCLTGKLSATFGNAVLGKKMFLEEYSDKKIHVFDSGSAGPGESLIVYKIGELIKKDLSFEEIVEQVENFIKKMKTFFVLDSVENLVANGRISKTKAFIVNALNIKPVLYAKDGVIEIYEKVRGLRKAHKRLVEIIGELFPNSKNEKTLIISHCNCLDKAKSIKKSIEAFYDFKNIMIVGMKGLTSMYAYDQGIIISY